MGSPHEYLLVTPVLLVGGVGHLLAAGALGQGGRRAAVLKHANLINLFGGLINYVDTKAKCRHLKNLPVKGLCAEIFGLFSKICISFEVGDATKK